MQRRGTSRWSKLLTPASGYRKLTLQATSQLLKIAANGAKKTWLQAQDGPSWLRCPRSLMLLKLQLPLRPASKPKRPPWAATGCQLAGVFLFVPLYIDSVLGPVAWAEGWDSMLCSEGSELLCSEEANTELQVAPDSEGYRAFPEGNWGFPFSFFYRATSDMDASRCKLLGFTLYHPGRTVF